MKDFNDILWERYRDTSLRVKRLERRYKVLMTIVLFLVINYGYLYVEYFR